MMDDETTFDPDALRKEFADYCVDVEPSIKARAPRIKQIEVLAIIGMTLFQVAKELKEEKAQQAAEIDNLKHDVERHIANHAADLNSKSATVPTPSSIEATAALIANGLVGQASEEDVREVERLINELLGVE